MAILTWVKSQQVFLKIQEGSGDALSSEDLSDGMVDYVLWNTFRPDDIGLDDALDMDLIDGGMLMFPSEITALAALPECYLAAFDKSYNKDDVIVLLQRED